MQEGSNFRADRQEEFVAPLEDGISKGSRFLLLLLHATFVAGKDLGDAGIGEDRHVGTFVGVGAVLEQ